MRGLLRGTLLVATAWVASAVASERATVAVVRSDAPAVAMPAPADSALSLEQTLAVVRAAVDQLGGMQAYVKPAHRWVVIKPNIVQIIEPRGSGGITDPYVVWAVARLVHEANPEVRISIAEGPADWVSPGHPEALQPTRTVDGFEVCGYRALLGDPALAGAQIDFIDLNFAAADQHPGLATGDQYWLPRDVLDCDVFIDVPVLKAIGYVGLTCAMKNLVGVMPGMKYGWGKNQGFPAGSGNPGVPNHRGDWLGEMIVDIASMADVDLVVVDAIVGMERARVPDQGGVARRLNTIVAGDDLVAVDAVCARMIGWNPDDLECLTLAQRLGIGIADLARIDVVGQPLAAVATRFEKLPKAGGNEDDGSGHFGQGNRTWLVKGPFALDDPGRWQPDPTHLRPVAGVDGWSEPLYFQDVRLDLKSHLGPARNCVAYAYAEFTAPRTQAAELWVASDDAIAVWLNGAQVLRFAGAREYQLPNDEVPVQIQEGNNALLVAVEQHRRRYAFSLNITEPEEDERYDGTRVMGLRFHVPGEAGAPAAVAADASEEPVEVDGWDGGDRHQGRITRQVPLPTGAEQDYVRQIAVEPDGSVLALSYSWLRRLGGDQWQLQYAGLDLFGADRWLRSVLVDSQGRFWACTNRGLRLAVGDSLVTYHAGHWFGGLAEALGGRLFCGSYDLPLHVFEAGRWRPLSPEEMGAGEPDPQRRGPYERVVTLAGSSDYLWVGTWGFGLYRYDGKEWRRFTRREGLACDHIERLAACGRQVLAEHDGAGLSYFDGRRWVYYDDTNGLSERPLEAVAFDGGGKPWIVQGDGRIARLHDGKWLGGFLSQDITAIADDGAGGLWLAARPGGLVRLALEPRP